MNAKPIPDGYHCVTPYLVVAGARRMLDFLREAFGAQVMECHAQPEGPVGHAEIIIGGSKIMMADSTAQFAPTASGIHLYVEDADAVFARAVKAGATVVKPLGDQFYGDRSGVVADAWGNWWCISTHVEDVPPEELARRAEEAMKAREK